MASGVAAMPVSRRKSPEPNARRNAPWALAMWLASSMPRADSTSGITGVLPSMRWKLSVTWSADSVLASMTPSRPGVPRRPARSSAQNRLVASLMRTQALPPALSQSTTWFRAWSFWEGSTASSISRMIESARDTADWSKSSVFMALTRSHERAISAGILRSGLTVSVAMVDVMYLPYPSWKQYEAENGQ